MSVRNSFLFFALLCYFGYICAAQKPRITCSIVYDVSKKALVIVDGKKTPYVAQAWFENHVNTTGWSYLSLQTNASYSDELQSTAAGMAEGYLTSDFIHMHHTNTLGDYCKSDPKFCAKLQTFMDQNTAWIKLQTAASPEDNYWHQVNLIFMQLEGLKSGYKARPGMQKIDDLGFFMMQSDCYLAALEVAFEKKVLSRAKAVGHCSALVKVFPGTVDLGVSHATWWDYNAMLRVFKRYEINVRQQDSKETRKFVNSQSQTFSSYPGVIFSLDDFYILSSGLVTLETTINISNKDLQKYITPNSVLEWVRVIVANRLARTGNEWVSLFGRHNSGNCNNQWMVVDYKQFVPEKPLQQGLLWILEQIPGAVEMADMTILLEKQGYWPSFNVPYFPFIYNMSGFSADKAKYKADFYDYNLNPRSQIFRRDHGKVEDMETFVLLMRYNDYQNDPVSKCDCDPPYSAEKAISARCDLNPANGTYKFEWLGHRRHGATDCKATNFKLSKDLSCFAVSGPTSDQQPPFQWSKTEWKKPVGHPDLWNFETQLVKWD